MALLGLVLLSAAAPGVNARAELPCSLTIDYTYENTPISQVAFRLYRVAELNNAYQPIYTGAFADWKWDPQNPKQGVLDLWTQVEANQLQPEYTLTTDDTGRAALTDLVPGVFLMVGDSATVGNVTHHVDKQIVSLPVQRDGKWESSLTLHPKSTVLPVQKLIQVTVVKRWDDRGYEKERPQAIGVSLLRDGKIVSNVVLSAANNWSYTWPDLLPNANWSVSEDVPEGYKMELRRLGNIFVLTNYRKDVPQTGTIWWPVITAGALGLLLILLGSALLRGRRRYA